MIGHMNSHPAGDAVTGSPISTLSYVWYDDLRRYDFGPGHPLAPLRVQLAHKLIGDFGILDLENVAVIDRIVAASPADLLRVHTAEYVAAVESCSGGSIEDDLAHGLGTPDVPVFAGMHDASALVCGATLRAAEQVVAGRTDHAVSLGGGLHHAMPNAASGFCVYNDVGVAIAWLLEQGVERIGYVDVDVHHGDGVQAMFYDDPRVMTISLHEDPRTLFPGTGRSDEIGGPDALGTAINIPLPAGTGDDAWLWAFDAVVPIALEAFNPQIIVSQQGCDSHIDDPLANLALTIEGQRASYLRIHDLAHERCGGRWIAVGGGGYEWVDVVPRAWTHLTAIAAHAEIDPHSPVPIAFRDFIADHLGRPCPERMGDGTELGQVFSRQPYGIVFGVDRAVAATKAAVFPHLGING